MEDRNQEIRRSQEGVWERGEDSYVWDRGKDENPYDEEARQAFEFGDEDGEDEEYLSDEALDIQRRVWALRVDLFAEGTPAKETEKLALEGKSILERDIDLEDNPELPLLTVVQKGDQPKSVVFRKDSITFQNLADRDDERVVLYNELQPEDIASLDALLGDAAETFIEQ